MSFRGYTIISVINRMSSTTADLSTAITLFLLGHCGNKVTIFGNLIIFDLNITSPRVVDITSGIRVLIAGIVMPVLGIELLTLAFSRQLWANDN